MSHARDPILWESLQAAVARQSCGWRFTSAGFVDPHRSKRRGESPDDIPEAAWGCRTGTDQPRRQGLILIPENSGAKSSMAMLVEAVRQRMPSEYRDFLGLCPDPTNQLRRFPDSAPLEDLEALPLDMLKIVHFKQMRSGDAFPSVDNGDLDCREMRDILEAKGYEGAAIMEIPPHDTVFDNLEASFSYLKR